MAKQYDFGYTNTSASASALTANLMDMVSSYAVTTDEPEECSLTNRTSPLNQREKITYRCNHQKVSQTGLAYPGPTNDGVLYSVRVDDILRVTDSDNPNFVVDEPISMWLTVKHSTSNNWTNAQVSSVLARLLGALYKGDTALVAGSFRFEDLMRSALKPTEE